MRTTPFVRAQLAIFAVVAVVALVSVAVFYVKVPAMVGIGRYAVSVELPSTGGLYQNANVAYRGVVVGRVQSVTLTPQGVSARLSIDSDAKIPADSSASVRSVSAVGEQFVQFVPPADGSSRGNLRDGSVVRSGEVPVEVSSLLSQADALLQRIQSSRLRRVVDESFAAFNGRAEDLQRLLDSLTLFADAANQALPQTVDLIRQAGPLLDTQTSTADDVRAWTRNVAAVTDQLRADDPQIRSVLDRGPGVANQAQSLFSSMDLTLPLLFDNLATVGRTGAVYLPNLRQVLVVYPRLLQALVVAINTEDTRLGANVNFSIAFGDPGSCSVGFLPADKRRLPNIQTPQDLPPGLLCRVPQDSNLAVRGTRNLPCVEFPGRRAPTPEECRTGYRPLGENVPFPKGLPGVSGLPNGSLTPATPSSYDGRPSVYAGTYDPGSGASGSGVLGGGAPGNVDTIGPDGKTYHVIAPANRSWQDMITGAVR